MCNPSSDWDTTIQPLAQVIFFVQPLTHDYFIHIVYYLSGNNNFTLIVIVYL